MTPERAVAPNRLADAAAQCMLWRISVDSRSAVRASLHLRTDSGEIHLELPPDAAPEQVLADCEEAMRAGRVISFPETLAPGAVRRTTVVVNFGRISAAWVDIPPA